MSDNLPIAAREMGGAIVTVLDWSQHRMLSPKTQYAIGFVVSQRPELNTEERVDIIADMAGFYGEEIDAEMTRIFDDFPVELVHAALDFLYETTWWGDADELKSKPTNESNRYALRATVRLLEAFQNNDYVVNDCALLDELVRKLGGLEVAWQLNEQEIATKLRAEEA